MSHTVTDARSGCAAVRRIWLRYLLTTLAITVIGIVAVCALPHRRILQFTSLHEISVVKISWIYQRAVFDPEPIDVAFFGTSRTAFAIDSETVERSYAAATGQDIHVVNFGIQHPGRNTAYLMARETLRHKDVRLFVIEVEEDESRELNPAFYEIADTTDLLLAPVIVNVDYLTDLAHLPARQTTLFAQSMFPELFGVRLDFDKRLYGGHSWNDTFQIRGDPDGPPITAPQRTGGLTPEELAAERQYVKEKQKWSALPGPLHGLEIRANLLYLDALLRLARQHGVAVRFLYLPSYGGPASPALAERYRRDGSLWYDTEIASHIDWWNDINHLNFFGATELSIWVGEKIADQNWK